MYSISGSAQTLESIAHDEGRFLAVQGASFGGTEICERIGCERVRYAIDCPYKGRTSEIYCSVEGCGRICKFKKNTEYTNC